MLIISLFYLLYHYFNRLELTIQFYISFLFHIVYTGVNIIDCHAIIIFSFSSLNWLQCAFKNFQLNLRYEMYELFIY